MVRRPGARSTRNFIFRVAVPRLTTNRTCILRYSGQKMTSIITLAGINIQYIFEDKTNNNVLLLRVAKYIIIYTYVIGATDVGRATVNHIGIIL